MTHRNLIVARLDPAHRDRVADLFAKSDSGALPHLVGVAQRTLYSFHDLYFHLVEADDDVNAALGQVRGHELFRQIDRDLSEFVKPYHPTWREPRDAMATPFYQWRRK